MLQSARQRSPSGQQCSVDRDWTLEVPDTELLPTNVHRALVFSELHQWTFSGVSTGACLRLLAERRSVQQVGVWHVCSSNRARTALSACL